MLLPDLTDAGGTTRHLAVGAGKDGNIYVVNRDAMGHFSKSGNNIWQQLTQVLGNSLSGGGSAASGRPPRTSTARVYYGSTGRPRSRPSRSAARSCPRRRASPASRASTTPAPRRSSRPTAASNGIVWAHQNTNPAVLYAFDATNTRPRAVQQLPGRQAVTSSAPATSSSPPWSRTARCSSARRMALPCLAC